MIEQIKNIFFYNLIMESILNLELSPNKKYLMGSNAEGVLYVWVFEDILVLIYHIPL